MVACSVAAVWRYSAASDSWEDDLARTRQRLSSAEIVRLISLMFAVDVSASGVNMRTAWAVSKSEFVMMNSGLG